MKQLRLACWLMKILSLHYSIQLPATHRRLTPAAELVAQMSPDQTADSQNSEVGKWLLFKAPSSKWVLYLRSQAGKSVTGTRCRTAEGHEDGQLSSPKGNRLCSSFQRLPLTIVHRTVVDSFKEKTNIKIFMQDPPVFKCFTPCKSKICRPNLVSRHQLLV